MAAQYLIRFDDICPGMNWRMFGEIERICDGAGVRPMLAVVPSNQDPKLDVDSKRDDFWQRVREWQARGWTIGLHGFQHRYVTRDAGLIGLNDRSEFAGLPAAEQTEKLEQGLEIFRKEGVRAEVFIAPGHSFDAATVASLRALGVGAISDGFFLSAHRDSAGTLWVPQQIWSFRYRPFGLWTVCYHHNGWRDGDLKRFAADVAAYRSRITSFAEVSSAPHIRSKSWTDDLIARTLLSTIFTKKWLKARITRSASR